MIADTAKIDLKVLAATPRSPSAGGSGVDLRGLIPIFHRWIQESALDELLIDVADYTHVPDGPGVVLVCHDAIYSLDSGSGELGLLYSRRRETHPSLHEIRTLDQRLDSVFERALAACARLEREPDLAGALRFPGDRFAIAINDRRVTRVDAAELESALERLAGRLFAGAMAQVDVAGGDGDRLTATLRLSKAAR
jgi:hypothetical protein